MSAASPAPDAVLTDSDRRALGLQIGVGLAALFVGVVLGGAQAIDRVGVDLYDEIPLVGGYYEGLTAHGVLNVLVFTFLFSNGFMTFVAARAYGRPPQRGLLWGSAGLAVVGTALAVVEILGGRASVLYTMYPPMQASFLYYLGILLVVLSTWATGWIVFHLHRRWRRENPEAYAPLRGHLCVATYAMWQLASIGVAVEVIALLMPWSAGWVEGIDPQLSRTLFWFTGHPIVYFWLLPVYVSWYTMIPHQAGGRLFSDPLARLVFVLFLLLSIPTGFHHQYTDPGIGHAAKVVHLVLTYGVFFPSMITAFAVVSALEDAGRRRGGGGLLAWIPRLPWGDPSVAAQVLSMVVFVFGGVSGLINASYNVNLVVHNTSWVPGHFHLTVGTAVALSVMGILYWMVPHLSGRALFGRRLALAQAWLWFGGVLVFARGQVDGGLEGLPRRLYVSTMTYGDPEWWWSHWLTAVGGSAMFVSGILFFVVILGTLLAGRRGEAEEPPGLAVRMGPERGWPVLERWGFWVPVTILLVAIAYAPHLVSYWPPSLDVAGMRPW